VGNCVLLKSMHNLTRNKKEIKKQFSHKISSFFASKNISSFTFGNGNLNKKSPEVKKTYAFNA
jgi:hypothetical protein